MSAAMVAGVFAIGRTASAAPSVDLVKDINTAVSPASPLCPPLRVGGEAFLCAYNFAEHSGLDIWRTDGTAAGTKRIGGNFDEIDHLTDVDGRVFFTAAGSAGIELWSSDGTSIWQVKDVNPGPAGSFPSNLTNVSGTLFFVADSPVRHTHTQLWKSDGTEAGTILLKDFTPDIGFIVFGPAYLTDADGTLFFTVYSPPVGAELWKSDGTASGTVLVADIYPGDGSSNPHDLVNVGGTLFFRAGDEAHGVELWKSDGTEAGTRLVEDLNPGSNGSQGPVTRTSAALAVNDLLFAVALDADGLGLWRSNGTAEGTFRLAAGINPRDLVAHSGLLFFSGSDGANGFGLWKSDGTVEGTRLLKTFGDAANPHFASSLVDAGGILFFLVNDGRGGIELWKSDGTSGGTAMVEQIPFGSAGPDYGLVGLDDTLLFGFMDAAKPGLQLWRSDGTAEGTKPFGGLVFGNDGSDPNSFANLDGALFFAATAGTNRGVWKSDGTNGGTIRVADAGITTTLAVVGRTLFFAGFDASHGYELWKTDGTDGGALIADLLPGSGSSAPHALVGVDGSLHFLANHPKDAPPSNTALGLWRSDGTPGGTVLLADVASHDYGDPPMAIARGTLFLIVDQHLWVSDGSAGGTFDLSTPARLSSVGDVARVDEVVFFTASDQLHGNELWRTDGTLAGTSLVADLTAGTFGSFPSDLTAMDGVLFFSANQTGSSKALWKSDGTMAGTVLVKDSAPGSGSFAPSDLTKVDGTLFFRANGAGTGARLWKSDGTSEGTVPVASATSDNGYVSSPFALTNVNGKLVFRAFDAAHGSELWVSDGSAAGTMMIAEIAPGFDSSSPRQFKQIGSDVFFSANDIEHGVELWRITGVSSCGDGVLDPGESCDDANARDGDGCDAACDVEATPYPTPTVTATPATPSTMTFTPTPTRTRTRIPTPTFATPGIGECGGDCNSDGAIDGADLPLLVGALFDDRGGLCTFADGNGDGRINAADLLVAASYLGACAARPTSTPTVPPPTPAPCGEVSGTRTVQLSLGFPANQVVSAVQLLLSYPESAVSLPSPPALSPRIGKRPPNAVVIPSILGGGRSISIVRPQNLQRGDLVTVTFDRCVDATQPSLNSFPCSVVECGSSFGQVDGCSCTVSDP